MPSHNWKNIHIEEEQHASIKLEPNDFCGKFEDVITTLPPKEWFKSKPRVDSGWGCGFRNIQTILSALAEIPEFSERLPSFTPSILSLQRLIESAWVEGFDSVGASQLNWKLMGTKKWIGATEIATLLGYLGIGCEILDFEKPTSRTPAGKAYHGSLVETVHHYLTDNIPFPIYLQFHGHSQTIVGCRGKNKGLFILDPSPRVQPKVKFCPAPALNQSQYQLVIVTGLVDDFSREYLKNNFNHRKIS